MANGNGGVANFLKGAGIVVTIITVFAIQAISADVRNKERDMGQDHKISAQQADMREVRTKLTYIESKQAEMHMEQRQGFADLQQTIQGLHSS